jgi:hypothetical protein
MTHRRLSEVIGFDELEGRLRVRLRSGSVPILDKDGKPVAVSDPVFRKQLCLGPSNAPLKLFDLTPRRCGIRGDKDRDSGPSTLSSGGFHEY